MKIIGITGGVGSGKSRVLSCLEEQYNAAVCQADHVAWELQRPGENCYEQIIEHFGAGILSEDGTINRQILGGIVFADSVELEVLNQIMHPAVKQRILDTIAVEDANGTALFVLEAALLLEDGYNEICDELWYVYANETVRRERLKEARGYTDEKINAIMVAQISEDIFRKGCRVVIDNSGTFENTCAQIEQILHK